MKKIFFGFLLLFLNLNITVNSFALNLLPNFIGYFLIYLGFKSITEIDTSKSQKITLATMVIAFVLYVLEVGGITIESGNIIYIVTDFLLTFFHLFTGLKVVAAYQQLEEIHHLDFKTGTMHLTVLLNFIVGLASIIGSIFVIPVIIVLVLVTLVLDVYFLVLLAKAYKAYPQAE